MLFSSNVTLVMLFLEVLRCFVCPQANGTLLLLSAYVSLKDAFSCAFIFEGAQTQRVASDMLVGFELSTLEISTVLKLSDSIFM